MSGEHLFGLHEGHLGPEADRIAEKHEATHTNHVEPGGLKRGWFSCDNRGEPFNSQTANAVMNEINKRLQVRWSVRRTKHYGRLRSMGDLKV